MNETHDFVSFVSIDKELHPYTVAEAYMKNWTTSCKLRNFNFWSYEKMAYSTQRVYIFLDDRAKGQKFFYASTDMEKLFEFAKTLVSQEVEKVD